MVVIKLIMVGDAAVGKTSYLARIADKSFSPSYLCTIGIDFYKDRRTFGQWSGAMCSPFCDAHQSTSTDTPLDVYTWDTAGQERFHSLSRTYFRGVHGVFVCFDITNRLSFDTVSSWIASVEHANSPSRIASVLIGTKHDLRASRQVSFDEAMAYATRHEMPYFETSAKTSLAIQPSYEALVQAVLHSSSFAQQTPSPPLPARPLLACPLHARSSTCTKQVQGRCPCG